MAEMLQWFAQKLINVPWMRFSRVAWSYQVIVPRLVARIRFVHLSPQGLFLEILFQINLRILFLRKTFVPGNMHSLQLDYQISSSQHSHVA